MSDTLAIMRDRLAELAPEHLDIEDESALHAGHAGARSGGGHYQLTIVSARFTGLSRLARQRLIYSTLGDLMSTRIHALGIRALSPEEI
ncbi:BolA family transcriptional regulator [Neisseriaceae bacterium JH1-16]|nr:BolA family transcriptional regulator [Neisseriaceae bacterium JH1-16]